MYAIKAKPITAENFKACGTSYQEAGSGTDGGFYCAEGNHGKTECWGMAFGCGADSFGNGACDDYVAREDL